MADVPGSFPARQVPLINQSQVPNAVPNQGHLYTNAAGALQYQNAAGVVITPGSGGGSTNVARSIIGRWVGNSAGTANLDLGYQGQSDVLGYRAPYAGNIIGIQGACTGPGATGNKTYQSTINGVATGGTMIAANNDQVSGGIITAVPFAAGDVLGVRITSTSIGGQPYYGALIVVYT